MKTDQLVTFEYVNHHGERSTRHVRPIRIFYGFNEWHLEPQWLLEAIDIDRDGQSRTFAIASIESTIQPYVMTDDRWHRGLDWMQTASGKAFFVMGPREDDIDIEDIAHGLAYSTRFNGHTQRPYSIAEHCVHVSHACDPVDAPEGLMHDAAEAYVGDIVRGVKRNLPDFAKIEKKVEEVIAKKFSLRYPWPDSVKRADVAVLAAERRYLMGKPPFPWRSLENVEPYDVRVGTMSPEMAKHAFLERFRELRGADPNLHAGQLRPRR